MPGICHYNGGHDAPIRVFVYLHGLTTSIFYPRGPDLTETVAAADEAG